jgi:putative transposase
MGTIMQLTERHVIKRTDPRWKVIDQAAFAAKNLYNAANYLMRQMFFFQGERILDYNTLYHQAKTLPAYQGLPRKVSQQVLKIVQKNWKGFLAARRECSVHPEKFLGKPRLPKYLDKQRGRFVLVYTDQALSRPALRQGWIHPSGLDIQIRTRQTTVDQVRIVPKKTHYVVEVVYEKAPEPAAVDPTRIAGVDLGINNLATIASNKAGFVPVIVNGRPLKAINQFYNKQRAEIQARFEDERFTTHRLDRMTDKRNRRLDHELHTASKRIIDLLVQEGIGTLIIGKNDGWKQRVAIGKRNNQTFVSIPHARFIHMLTYKAELRGLRVIVTEESHTSKCSFLDGELVCHHDHYVGKRVRRGLFRAADVRHINADVNGAYNIIRKVAPDAFSQGSRGCVVHPLRLAA